MPLPYRPSTAPLRTTASVRPPTQPTTQPERSLRCPCLPSTCMKLGSTAALLQRLTVGTPGANSREIFHQQAFLSVQIPQLDWSVLRSLTGGTRWSERQGPREACPLTPSARTYVHHVLPQLRLAGAYCTGERREAGLISCTGESAGVGSGGVMKVLPVECRGFVNFL